MSVNKVILIGNLGNDPDIKYLPNGDAVANFSIATSEQWTDKNSGEKKENTEWHRVVAYRRLAEIVGKYCRKGSKVYVEGKLKTRSWVDQQSQQTRYMTEIVADNLQMLGSRGVGEVAFDDSANNYGKSEDYANSYSATPNQNNFSDGMNNQALDPDDDVPF